MKSSPTYKRSAYLFSATLAVATLYALSVYNYLLFHTLIELVSVLTAFGIFALAWHTRATQDNDYLLFIGIALLFAGVLDLLHLISFKGMGVFPPDDGNLATQFWVAFRTVFSLSFLASVLFIRAKLNIGRTVALYLAVVSVFIVSILFGWFPACYKAGVGLTRFKIVSEYVICLVFLAALVLLVRKRHAFDPGVVRFTFLALLFSIATEISFTEYASVYGFSNMLGHLFLLASVASMYRAIVVTAVVEPSRLLFRDLTQREETIRESEKKYRLLFENMINALAYHRIICDEQGRPSDYVFLEVNTAFEALTGLKAADIIGKGVREVLPGIENDPADWIGIYGKVALTGQPVRIEQLSTALDKWFSVSAYSPEPNHFVAVFEDITERKRAEQALRESGEQFRTLADSIPNLAWWANSDGYITWYNRRWYDYTGTTPEQMEGWGWQTVHDPAMLPQVLERWKASLATGEPFDMEFPLRGADGLFRPFLTRVMPVKDSAGKVLRWFGTNTDVSERKRAEEALRENEERLRLFIEHAPAALAMFDRSMRYVSVSRRWLSDYGLGDRDLRGLSHYEIFPEITEAWRDVHRRALAGEVVRNDSDRFERTDGSVQWLQWEVRPWHTAAGEIAGIVIFSEDITERKRAEEALQQSMRRFELLSGTAGDLLLSTDPQAVVDSIYRKVMDQLKCDVFFNFLVDESAGKLHLNAYAGISPEEARRIEWLDFGVAVCGCAARDGRRIVAEHIPTTLDTRTDLIKSYGIKAYACHPILGPAGKVLGTLSFGTRFRETFSEDDLSLMKAVTDQVAVAMIRMRDEQALRRAHDELELRVRERTSALLKANEHLEREIGQRLEIEGRTLFTNELLKLYTRKFSRKEYLDTTVELIRKWSGCRHTGIRITDENGNLPFESCEGYDADFLRSESRLSLAHDQCTCTRVAAGEPDPGERAFMTPVGSFFCNDTTSFVNTLSGDRSARYRGTCTQYGFRSLAVIPVRHRERTLGTIHLADERPGRVPLEKVEFVEQLSVIIGEALVRFAAEEDLLRQREELVRMNEQLRNLSAHVDAVREGERTSIAREIHDELGQVLTAIKMDATWIRNRLSTPDPKLAEKAGETLHLIDGAIQSVKRISSELRPGVLDDIGLAAAVEWAAKDFQKRTGIACAVIVDPENMIVDRMRSTALFRILQESLTNIMRHAKATQVTISLTQKDNAIALAVSDNGKGIDPEELASPHAFGLIGMRERVQFLHGSIRIAGIPEAGTTVMVTLPINSEKGHTAVPGHADPDEARREPGNAGRDGRAGEQ